MEVLTGKCILCFLCFFFSYSQWKNFSNNSQRPRKLCTVRGEVKETEMDGGEARTSPGSDGGEETETGQRETAGEAMKGKEIHHPQTERGTEPGEERTGESIEAGRRTDLQKERGLEKGIEEERGTGIGSKKEIGIGRGTEIERGRGSVQHHQLGKILHLWAH